MKQIISVFMYENLKNYMFHVMLLQEANLPQTSYDVPSFLHEKGPCMDAVSCEKCIEER